MLESWSFLASDPLSTPVQAEAELFSFNPTTDTVVGSALWQGFQTVPGGGGYTVNSLAPVTFNPGITLSDQGNYLMALYDPSGDLYLGTDFSTSSPLGGQELLMPGESDPTSNTWGGPGSSISLAYTATIDSGGVQSVPDGGSTVMLLGIGCLGMCAVGKFRASRMAQAS